MNVIQSWGYYNCDWGGHHYSSVMSRPFDKDVLTNRRCASHYIYPFRRGGLACCKSAHLAKRGVVMVCKDEGGELILG